jgi:subtilisin family serine protease
MRSTRTLHSIKFFASLTLAIVAVSSVAMAQKAQLGTKSDGIPATVPDSLPPSMQKTVQVMVELQDAPAATTWAAALKQAQAQADAQRNYALQHPNVKTSQALLKSTTQRVQISSNSAKQVQSIAQKLDQTQKTLLTSLTGPKIGGQVIYRAQLAYNGIAMAVSPDKIADITALPGVKGVHPMNPKFPTAAFSDIDFLGTRGLWTKDGLAGNLGDGVVVADIDTGLDYIHANFGGSGTYPVSSHTGAYPGTAKAPIGYDFAGDSYNANGTGPALIPSPDPDPFDCNGHGTATASLIAGYGMNNDGSTYILNYDGSNPSMASLKCAPGLAPHAKIAALRVFGCAGSTNLVTNAIEWVMGYNMNAAVAGYPAGPHNPPFIHVISMSLGANEGFADDPDDVAASNAASTGVIVVSAAGNAGDSYYIHSSPAAASGTLGVAATFNDQNGYIFDSTLTGNAPPSFAGQQDKTIYTTTSPHTSATGDVVYAVNPISPSVPGSTTHDGGQPLTNAAFCSGKIVMVDRIPGQGSAASVNCQNAGAIAIIDVADNNAGGNPFFLTTSGALTHPMVVCSTSYGTLIKTTAAFDANGVSTSSPAVNVTMAPGSGAVIQPANPPGSAAGAGSPDTLPTYSSRGPRLPDSAIKPDLAAPAEVVGVAQPFSGNGIENSNGTSSATPHVAGEMALLRQLHSTWSVQELLALACDTATHDMATTVGGATQIGVGRIGAGRIDLTNAANANVVAYNGTDTNLIGVSFGVVEVPVDGSSVQTKNITVTNKGVTNVTYNTSIANNPALTGGVFTVNPANFTVNAGTTFTATVTFTGTGSTLKHAREASVSATQGNPRQWLTEAGGYAVFTPTDASPILRVAVYAAPKPTSSMHATITGVVPTAPNTGSFNINLSGSSVNTGASLGNGFDILSLVKAFELQYINPAVGSTTAPTDRNVIKYVGVTSDYVTRAPTTAARIVWGVEGFGDAPEPRFTSSDKEIFIDTGDGAGGPPDGTADFAIFLTNNGTGQENVFLPAVAKLHAGTAVSSGRFTNGLAANVADTNAYNNSCVTMEVDASTFVDAANGYPALATPGHTRFNYQVVTFDRNGNEVDETPVLTYDLAAPGMEVENSAIVAQTVFSSSNDHVENFWYKDLPSNFVPVNYNGTNFKANFSKGVMLMHMHNGDGNRVDVVAFRKPTISSFSPTSGSVGAQITITGSNFNAGTVVKFFNNQTAAVNVITGNTLVATVPAGAASGPLRVENAAGFSTKPGFTVLP